MLGLVDTLAILVLTGVGFVGSPTAALPAVVWIAFATPALARADVARRRLPNALTLPAVALAAGCALVRLGVDPGAQEPRSALVALTATALTGWLVSRTGALGLGDVKLATALVGSVVLVAAAEAWVFAGVTAAAGAGWALVDCRGGGGRRRARRRRARRICIRRRASGLRGIDAGGRLATLGFGLHGGRFAGAGARGRLATLGFGLRGGRFSGAGARGRLATLGTGVRGGRFAGAGARARLATLGFGLRGGPRRSSAAGRAGVVPESRVRGQDGSAAAPTRPTIPYGPCLLLGYWSALFVEAVT